MELKETLSQMAEVYRRDPTAAVRGQAFINLLHAYLADQYNRRLSPSARTRGVQIVQEATLYGSHKPKDVDVTIIDPQNGPLVITGIRSQMSSIGKNVLNYYEGIIGECISLQDRFPRSVHAYVYLMPAAAIKEGRQAEAISHHRYAEMYAKITGRGGQDYYERRGIYDQFAYMIVDFNESPPSLIDEPLANLDVDLRMETFIERVVDTFLARELFIDLFAV